MVLESGFWMSSNLLMQDGKINPRHDSNCDFLINQRNINDRPQISYQKFSDSNEFTITRFCKMLRETGTAFKKYCISITNNSKKSICVYAEAERYNTLRKK